MEASQPHPGHHSSSRMSEHPNYFLNDHFIESLEIQGIRCYFQPFKETETFETIQQQLTRISDKPIPLDQSNIVIDKDMPLNRLITSQKDLKVFQKTMNKIAAKKPVDLQDFPENKEIFTKLVSNIDKHNIQKGIQSKGQIQIVLKGREQFASKIIYRTTSGTRLRDILNYIDKQARKVVPPIRVADNSNIYDLSQQGQALQVKTKSLVIEYPPPLALKQEQQFLIHLNHSSFEEGQIRPLVEPKSTLSQIIRVVKMMLKEESQPLDIKDSFGNILGREQWDYPITKFYLRKFQFYFSYKPLGAPCHISILGLPNEPIETIYQIKRNTTIHHIVQHIRKTTSYPSGEFLLSDSQGEPLLEEAASQSIHNLKLDLNRLKAVYRRPKGYLRGNTLLLSQKGTKSFQQIQVKKQNTTIGILCYNEGKHQIQKGHISCLKKEVKKMKLLSIEVIVSHQYKSIFKIQCTEDTPFLTEELVWKSAGRLKIGQRLMMVKENFREITSRCITQIHPVQLQEDEELFSFEVQQYHTFIANHFIVHNENALALTAYIFSKDKPMEKKKVSCYLHNKINDVSQFKGKKVVLGGGLLLNNQLTFGDYSINDFRTVSVFDGTSKEESMLIISQWRDQSYVIGQQQATKIELLRNKWSSQYLALQDSRIVEVSNNLSTFEQPSKLSHILVGPKIILSKLYYLSNIQPRHSNKQQKVYQQFKKQWPMNSSGAKGQLSEKDVYPIYLYTTNHMYRELNAFLRSKDRSGYGQMDAEKWYTATNLIYRSLEKLPFIQEQIEVYRGISQICLDKAFCLTQKNKPFCISQTKDKERYMNTEAFTSCSTDRNVSKGFAGAKGALLTFRGKFRQSICSYSAYAHENQVLLPPYLYFMITAYDLTKDIQTMTLQEIPFPRTLNNKLIYWVDDIPSNNTHLVQQFEKAGIEVVQVTTTRIMKVILRDFFSILHAFGKKIVIISDMARQEEGGVWNYQAGVELFNLIYNDYGMSNKAIIFTGNREKALQSINHKGVKKGNWEVFTGCSEVRDAVLNQFK